MEGVVQEVEVTAMAAGGAGVAHLEDGRVVFVHRTAPGDRVRIRVEKARKRWARGAVLEILEEGAGRRVAPCPRYDRCGGCTLEHLEYAEQLRWKGRIVADALERIGGLDVEPPEVVPSPREFRYRSRVSFTLRRLEGGRVVAGFRELERPGRVLDVGQECLLPTPALARAWGALRRGWGPGAGRLGGGRELRLTLREAGAGVVLVVEGARDDSDAGALVAEVGPLVAVWSVDDDGRARLLAGEPDPVETWMGERIPVRGAAFLQVNREAAAHLHEAVLEGAGPVEGRAVVDAYSGVGAYGRPLARGGARVTGIELDPQAVEAAREGAPEGFRMVEGRVEERLGECLPADVVVLNPPRAGLDESVTEVLAERVPGRIVYASCDPATLARDLKRMGTRGRAGTGRGTGGGVETEARVETEGRSGAGARFILDGIRAFDLFPQTAHVEVVAVLVPAGDSGGSVAADAGSPDTADSRHSATPEAP